MCHLGIPFIGASGKDLVNLDKPYAQDVELLGKRKNDEVSFRWGFEIIAVIWLLLSLDRSESSEISKPISAALISMLLALSANAQTDFATHIETVPQTSHYSRDVKLAANERYLFSSSMEGSIKVWDSEYFDTTPLIRSINVKSPALAFDVNMEMTQLVTAHERDLRLWHVETGALIETASLDFQGVAFLFAKFLPSQNSVIASDELGNVYIWTLATNELKKILLNETPVTHGAIRTDGSKEVLLADETGNLLFLDGTSLSLLEKKEIGNGPITNLNLTSDSDFLAAISEESLEQTTRQNSVVIVDLVSREIQKTILIATPKEDVLREIEFFDDDSSLVIFGGYSKHTCTNVFLTPKCNFSKDKFFTQLLPSARGADPYLVSGGEIYRVPSVGYLDQFDINSDHPVVGASRAYGFFDLDRSNSYALVAAENSFSLLDLSTGEPVWNKADEAIYRSETAKTNEIELDVESATGKKAGQGFTLTTHTVSEDTGRPERGGLRFYSLSDGEALWTAEYPIKWVLNDPRGSNTKIFDSSKPVWVIGVDGKVRVFAPTNGAPLEDASTNPLDFSVAFDLKVSNDGMSATALTGEVRVEGAFFNQSIQEMTVTGITQFSIVGGIVTEESTIPLPRTPYHQDSFLSFDGSRVFLSKLPLGSNEFQIDVRDTHNASLVGSITTGNFCKYATDYEYDGKNFYVCVDNSPFRENNYLTIFDAESGAKDIVEIDPNVAVVDVKTSKDGSVLYLYGDSEFQIWRMDLEQLLIKFLSSGEGEWVSITEAGFFTGSDKANNLLSVTKGFKIFTLDQFEQALYRPDYIAELLAGDLNSTYETAASNLNLDRILSSGPAPVVTVLDKLTKFSEDGLTAMVSFQISDDGGGIGNQLEIRAPGGTRKGEKFPVELAKVTATAVVLQQRLPLPTCFEDEPCEAEKYEVSAYNGDGLAKSIPVEFFLSSRGVRNSRLPQMHVLAVGVSKYDRKDLKLSYAAADAEKIASALKAVGKKPDETGYSLFTSVNAEALTDGQAIQTQINDYFENNRQNILPQDVFVFYISGHGRQLDGNYVYLPSDYPAGAALKSHGILQSTIDEWLGSIDALKVVVIIDTCEAGAAEGLIRSGRQFQKTAYQRLESATGANLLAASRSKDPAYEGYREHGVFTYAVLESLDRSIFGDSAVTVGAIAQHSYDRVPELARQIQNDAIQYPVRKLSGVEFPIGFRAEVLDEDSPAHETCELEAPLFGETTHRLNGYAQLWSLPNTSSDKLCRFPPDHSFRGDKISASWFKVTRGGTELGFVDTKHVRKLQ